MSPQFRALIATAGGIALLAGIVISPLVIDAQSGSESGDAGVLAPVLPKLDQTSSTLRLDAPNDIPRGRLSTCNCQVTSTLKTDTVRLCDPVDVEVKVVPECPVCDKLDVIFIQIDTPHWQWERDESLKILNEITRWASTDEREVRIGVIQYNGTTVRTVTRMTKNNIGAARGKLSNPGTGHDPRGLFEEATREGVKMLQQARRTREGNEQNAACEFVVWFAYTKEYDTEKGEEMIRAGQQFHRQGVELHFGCPHRHPEECNVWEPRVPKSNRFYSEPEDSGKMAGMARNFFETIEDAESDTRIRLRTLVLGQEFPEGLTFVPDSASEVPSEIAETATGTRMEWTWRNVRSLEPFTVTYRLTPTLSGAWPVTGDLTLTDMEGKLNEDMADAGSVEVLDEICFPTPTPTNTPEPTPTDTSVPPSPTPTSTITLTPTPSVRIIYLPIARRDPEMCVPESIYADAVLVLDMSTSMYRETRSGRTKHEAALAAARTFIEQLELEEDALGRHDRVGIAGFNDTAWTSIGLSNDAEAIDSALDALLERIDQGTRLDLALLVGQSVLDESERVDGNRPVVILLTDGLPNRVPLHPVTGRQEETVLAAADAAKAAGSRVFTIGLGDPEDVAHELLKGSASAPDDFYYAPDGDDLESIYRQIAGRITECPMP